MEGKGKQGAKKASKLRAEWEKSIVKNGYIMNLVFNIFLVKKSTPGRGFHQR